jgi:hypothetical protein
MKKATYSASSLKILLITLLIIFAAVAIGGFYYAQDWFNKYETSINEMSSSSATEMSPTQLNNLRIELTKYQSYINKTNSISAPQSDYHSAIQQDLNTYASATGIKITDFGPSNVHAPSTLSALPVGIQPAYVSVTIQNPVQYSGLVQFISAIETNLPKMRLTGINLKKADNPSGSVVVDPLVIEVYLR